MISLLPYFQYFDWTLDREAIFCLFQFCIQGTGGKDWQAEYEIKELLLTRGCPLHPPPCPPPCSPPLCTPPCPPPLCTPPASQARPVPRRPSRGRISKQNKRSKKSSWGCFCLRLNIRNPKTPENLTKHEFEIITRSWSKNRKTFERLRCSSATNLTIKHEIYDLQKGAGQPCKTFSPPHKRCFTVTNTTLKHRHSYPQIFHHMCIKMAVFSPSEI